jgi:adenosine deaminase
MTSTNKMGLWRHLRISSEVRRPFTQLTTPLIITPDLFQPLFEVTKDPSTHPELHVFLQRVVGFDTVDDESKTERRYYKKFPFPRLWNTKQSPPYSYWYVIQRALCGKITVNFKGLLHVCEHGQSE